MRSRPPIPRPRNLAGVNPIQQVIHQAACMTHDEQDQLMKRFRTAFAALASGRGDLVAWSTMADMCNLSEALAELRVGNNLVDEIERGQAALSALMSRVQAGAGWTLDGRELAAIGECVVVYRAQVELCSRGEHQRAEELVRRRIDAALRAGPGRTGKQLIHAHPADSISPTCEQAQ